MGKQNIFIWGSSSHAQCILNIVEKEGKYNLKFLFDPTLENDSFIFGYPVYHLKDDLKRLININDIKGYSIGIGDNFIRKQVYNQIELDFSGLSFITSVHPTANIEKGVVLNEGVIVMGGAFLETKSKVDKGSWIGVNASLGFSNTVGEFSSIAVNSCIGGNTKIGNLTAITMCVTVLQKLKIGNNCVIGSGSLVTNSVDDNILAYGSPAKVIRNREDDGKYL